MEFYMDVLVKYVTLDRNLLCSHDSSDRRLLTASEKEGGWGKEKSAPVSKASGDDKSKDAASLSKTV